MKEYYGFGFYKGSSMKAELDARYATRKEEKYIASLKREVIMHRILLVIAIVFVYSTFTLFVLGKLCA